MPDPFTPHTKIATVDSINTNLKGFVQLVTAALRLVLKISLAAPVTSSHLMFLLLSTPKKLPLYACTEKINSHRSLDNVPGVSL